MHFYNHIHLPTTPTSPQTLASTNLFSISIILSFQNYYILINGIIQDITFRGCLLSQYNFLETHSTYRKCHSFLLYSIPWFGCTTLCLSINQLMDIGLFLVWDSCDQRYYGCLHTSLCVEIYFHFFEINTQECNI